MKDNHGANIFELSRKYNFNPKEILDFSSNINPLGTSKRALQYLKDNLELVSAYPDSKYYALKEEISKFTSADQSDIFLGSGTTQLIREYTALVKPKKAMLFSPCYSEYENELKKHNSKIYFYNLSEENNFEVDVDNLILTVNTEKIELLTFANPNNPTGTILSREQIEKILSSTDVKLLLDETYVEFTNKNNFSSIPLTKKYKNLFVIRGVSKFFAAPGIRLGYGITSDEDSKMKLNENSMLWGINIFADLMGRVMFSDSKYQSDVFEFIKRERNYLLRELSSMPEIKVFKSEGNFILCKILTDAAAHDLREHLLTKAMVIRDCSSFKNLNEKYFRFCILNEEDNKKLIAEIKKFFNKAD
ncbi:histidinol-phosphate transaminase [Peptoniphilus sp. oral taxon 386]|uniref:pyridoxal phosphate-dependent aminotransferase n=1 Tax=Peptoniphilus sp. oral taxon 386 TaxID=652713 RepID=UPI0001DAA178|nr:histidinol-phosphate transaminase [Peptoniphilus sp. oral taxon 386]EFI41713.1 aminotransferase, class I/II [Peptoniphilus sp. oral taxon 386 str. F0131]